MKHRRAIGRIILTLSGWVVGGVAIVATIWLLRPRKRTIPLPIVADRPGSVAPEFQLVPRPDPLPIARHLVAPPRLKIGMVGMTRFVAALAILATVTTAAGMIGMAHSRSTQNRAEAIALTGGDPVRGETAIQNYGCASCHTIPGIRGANAQVGPPLTKMGGRMYVAGVLANTPDNMIHWIINPPGVDSKTAMPNLHVTEADARDIACYLYTLR